MILLYVLTKLITVSCIRKAAPCEFEVCKSDELSEQCFSSCMTYSVHYSILTTLFSKEESVHPTISSPNLY